MPSRQNATGCYQATLNHRDVSGCGSKYQDARETGNAKTMSLMSGCNTCASDTRFIFTDVLSPIEVLLRPWKSILIEFIIGLSESAGYTTSAKIIASILGVLCIWCTECSKC